MSRPVGLMGSVVTSVRERLSGLAGQSERTLLLGTILVASTVSAVMGFVLTQYYSVDVLSSLLYIPEDCWLDWGMQVGRHCFSDYEMPVDLGMQPNPWEPYPVFWPSVNYEWHQNNYPAAAMLPELVFGLPAEWVGAPRLGLLGYLLALTASVFAPAVWAARGALGLERIVVFVACGAAAIPAWAVIDRGNSVGFLAPLGLVFLVALCRRRWGLVALMVVLAALIKPQFAVLVVALFAARQWRWGGLAVAGGVLGNLAAYLLWPSEFPRTIVQSIGIILNYGDVLGSLAGLWNASLANGLLLIPDNIASRMAGGALPEDFLAGPRALIGYGLLVLVVVCVLVLGRRIPPVMVGIVLLATASLFPAQSNLYYLVFVLPVAALVARNPDGPPGSGIFDRLGERRRAVGVFVSLAAALTIAQMVTPHAPGWTEIPGQRGATGLAGTATTLPTTRGISPFLWLIAFVAIIVSYARRPAPVSLSEAAECPVQPV